MTRQESGPFLLNAANRRVVRGQSRVPAPAAGWATHVVLLLFVVPFLVGGQIIASQLPETWHTWSRLNSEGVEAPATVVSAHQVGVRSTRYYVTYTFQDAGGHVHTVDSRVSRAVYGRLCPGSPLSIRYVPTEPTLSTPSPREAWPRGPLTSTVFLVFLGGGTLILLVVAVRPLAFAWRFSRRGRLLAGEVVDSRIRLVKGRRILVVHYGFRTPTARFQEGRATRGLGTDALPEPGTELAIAYVDDRRHQPL